MNILFVFGGALTAYQEKVIDEVSMTDDVMVSNSVGDREYDLLVIGSGIKCDVSHVSFSAYAEDMKIEEAKKKKAALKEAKIAAKSEAE